MGNSKPVLSYPTRFMCRTGQNRSWISHEVLYFFKKNLLILFYTTSAKRKILLLFISQLVWKQIKLFEHESCRTGHVTPVKWNLHGFTIEEKNYLMCYLLWHETYPISKNKLSGIKYNRRKWRKTCPVRHADFHGFMILWKT